MLCILENIEKALIYANLIFFCLNKSYFSLKTVSCDHGHRLAYKLNKINSVSKIIIKTKQVKWSVAYQTHTYIHK